MGDLDKIGVVAAFEMSLETQASELISLMKTSPIYMSGMLDSILIMFAGINEGRKEGQSIVSTYLGLTKKSPLLHKFFEMIVEGIDPHINLVRDKKGRYVNSGEGIEKFIDLLLEGNLVIELRSRLIRLKEIAALKRDFSGNRGNHAGNEQDYLAEVEQKLEEYYEEQPSISFNNEAVDFPKYLAGILETRGSIIVRPSRTIYLQLGYTPELLNKIKGYYGGDITQIAEDESWKIIVSGDALKHLVKDMSVTTKLRKPLFDAIGAYYDYIRPLKEIPKRDDDKLLDHLLTSIEELSAETRA